MNGSISLMRKNCVWFLTQLFSSPHISQTGCGFLSDLIFLNSISSFVQLFHTVHHFIDFSHILPEIYIYFFFLLLYVLKDTMSGWGPGQYTLGGSDWAEGWTRWPPDIPSNLNHSTILCLFWHDVMFYVFCIMFSNVHSTLILSNRNWILAIIELLVNVFTSIFEVTMRPSRSDNKIRCTFVYLWLGIHTTLHSLFFNYWINTFIFRQFNFLVTHSCEKFLLLHLVIFRLCVICELGNICELISPFPT